MAGPRSDLARRLRDEGDKMVAYLRSLPDLAWGLQIYPGDDGDSWDLRQLVWHLVSAERGFYQLITDIVAGGEGAPAGMDVDAYNAGEMARLAGESQADLLGSFLDARQATIDLLGRMSDADLERQGRHPYLGWTDLAAFIKLIYRHNMLHIRDVKRKVEH